MIAGREVQLRAGADVVAMALDGRPAGVVSFHGLAGMGKTALLRRIETEVEGRGGIVVALAGGRLDEAAVSLVAAARRADDAGPNVAATGERSDGSVAQAYRQAAEAAAAAGRALVVLVDDLHTTSDAMEGLFAAHASTDGGSALVVAGAHNHAGLRGMPDGLRTVEVGYLDPDATVEALQTPFDGAGRVLPEPVLERAAELSGGVPLAVQAWGEALWQATHDTVDVDVDALVMSVWARLGREYTKVWGGLTGVERAYVAAIATETGQPVSTGAAAAAAGYHTVQQASMVRARLLDAGILHSPARGQLEVAVAGLGRWLAVQCAVAFPTLEGTPLSTEAPAQPLAAQPPIVYHPKR